MCIRDSDNTGRVVQASTYDGKGEVSDALPRHVKQTHLHHPLPSLRYSSCLLYTSDAADEEDSVDFVGLRNIKKKKKKLFFFFFKQKTAYEM